MVRIQTICVGMFQSNCFVVSCSDTSKAVIVDAGDEADKILSVVKAAGASVEAIICTHAHLDHVGALPDLTAELGVPVLMHREEIPVYESVEAQAAMFGLQAPDRVPVDRLLDDGEEIQIGNVTATVVHAPGHSPGSVCIVFGGESPERVIAGDVLFRGSIGRTDLPGGSYETIMRTLATVFLPMPDDTVVYCGHGPETTIGEEKKWNPFLGPLTTND